MNKAIKYTLLAVIALGLIIVAVKVLGGPNSPVNPPKVVETNTKIVKHKHYEYEIPKEWEYSQEIYYFELSNNNSEKAWNAIVTLFYDNEATIFEKTDRIEKDLTKEGYTFTSPKFETLGGTEFMIYNTSIVNDNGENENRLIGYMHSGNKYAYKIEIAIKSNKNDDGEEIEIVEDDYLNILLDISQVLLNGKHDDTDTIYRYYTYDLEE